MKNLLVLIFVVSTLNLTAQDVNPTQKGNLMVGGSGNISYFTEIDESSTGTFYFTLSPSIGWFLSDGLALGIGPSFQISGIFSDDRYAILGIGTDIFVAKYFGSGIFIKGSTGYSLSRTFFANYDYDNTTHNIQITPEVGYAIFLGPNVALELSLTNRFSIRKSENSRSFYNNSGVKAGFQIFL